MSKYDVELEKEAEELKKQAKEEVGQKNYDLAILLLMDAKDIYIQLGFQGQINMMDKQIARYKNVVDFEKKTQVNKKTFSDKQKLEAEGNSLLQIKSKKSGVELSIAEKRRIKLQELREKEEARGKIDRERTENRQRMEKAIEEERQQKVITQTEGMRKKAELQQKRTQTPVKSQFDRKKREQDEKEKKMQMLREQKKQKEILLNQADNALDQGKKLVDSKQYSEAKPFYQEAIELFTKLGWAQQVDVLKHELRNIDKYDEEYKKKKEAELINREKKEAEFQQRVDQLLEEKKKKEEEKLAKLRALPPQMQQNLEKAKMLVEKAEKEVGLKKYQRAISRYQYIIELYQSIPTDKLDLSVDISEINKKIVDLEGKN